MYPAHQIDFYKSGHIYQYPENTECVFSNFTARKSRMPEVKGVVFFGLQYFVMEYLQTQWNEYFFHRPKAEVLSAYKHRMDNALGVGVVTTNHIAALHDLGYLPVEIRALPEGSVVPIGVPMLTLHNTGEFFWLTNYLETIMSCILWGPCTSATIAHEYKKILNHYADYTVGDRSFVTHQAHDFSFRGMYGLEAAMMSGAAHLLSFIGTDTVPAIDFLERYYGAGYNGGVVGSSVPATEHSVMSMGGQEDEIRTFRRLIVDTYPAGVVSIVSDTWDFWKVITEYLPALKYEIMSRDGKVVIRPDSGDPVKIICGDPDAPAGTPEHKGAVECVWELFGGTTTAMGYKLLDQHIGLIYGDGITLERCRDICIKLKRKEFASTNMVFGVGSYSYQYNTRDTFGFAVKATYGEVGGVGREIFKKPKTDDGTKNSAKGLLAVYGANGAYTLKSQANWDQVYNDSMYTVFSNGQLIRRVAFNSICSRLTMSE